MGPIRSINHKIASRPNTHTFVTTSFSRIFLDEGGGGVLAGYLGPGLGKFRPIKIIFCVLLQTQSVEHFPFSFSQNREN